MSTEETGAARRATYDALSAEAKSAMAQTLNGPFKWEGARPLDPQDPGMTEALMMGCMVTDGNFVWVAQEFAAFVPPPDSNLSRAIAHGREWVTTGWEWKPGQVMLCTTPDGWASKVVARVGGLGPEWADPSSPRRHVPAEAVPDPRDDGFLGHAIAQVRRAWDLRRLFVRESKSGHFVVCPGLNTDIDWTGPFSAGTESEALLAAMKVRPR